MTDMSMTGGALRAGVPSNLTSYFRWINRAVDIELRESLKLADVESMSVAVLPGQAATQDAISRDKARRALIDLTRKFFVQGFSWSAGAAVRISEDTTNAAAAFLLALPSGAALPKISPDGEGGLLMVWEYRGDLVIAVIDGWRIHLVARATTPDALYLDDRPFDGEQIPKAILESIPAR